MNYRERHQRQEKLSRTMTWLAVVICLVATLAYLRSRLWIVDLSYEYSSLQKQLTTLKNDNAQARLQVSRLKSPARIEKIARERLGLKAREEMGRNVTIPVAAQR